MTRPIEKALQSWHEIAETKDVARLASLLAEDVVFLSPVVHTPQRGRRITQAYLAAAMTTLGQPSFRYLDEIVGESRAVLEFTVQIDGIEINGIDMISVNDQGEITEFKVMIRPLQAINLVHRMMGERLQRGG